MSLKLIKHDIDTRNRCLKELSLKKRDLYTFAGYSRLYDWEQDGMDILTESIIVHVYNKTRLLCSSDPEELEMLVHKNINK